MNFWMRMGTVLAVAVGTAAVSILPIADLGLRIADWKRAAHAAVESLAGRAPRNPLQRPAIDFTLPVAEMTTDEGPLTID